MTLRYDGADVRGGSPVFGMRRREFITLLGGAAAWPSTVCAQQPAMPVVGFLRSAAAAGSGELVGAFRQGLKEAGFVEGQNVAVEYRFADDQDDRIPGLAAELVRRQVAVIYANGVAVPAIKAATATIPIVFTTGFDPVRTGFVASLSRPGGNVTGVVFTTTDLAAKQQLEDLRHLYAHNYAGEADDEYFARDRHVLAADVPLELTSGAKFDGRRVQLDLPHLRTYSSRVQSVLERFQ
jgi:hypothetical protein